MARRHRIVARAVRASALAAKLSAKVAAAALGGVLWIPVFGYLYWQMISGSAAQRRAEGAHDEPDPRRDGAWNDKRTW